MANKKHELLERYRNNNLSKDELIDIFDMINSPEGRAEYDQFLSEQLEELNDCEIPLHVDSGLMFQEIKQKANIKKTKTFSMHNLRKFAAILLLVMLTASMTWLVTRKSEDITEENIVFSVKKGNKGNKGNLFLPDGSEVWLNTDSKISYCIGSKERKITLDGEAYLHVTKDKKHQFIVNTAFGDIIVYGTSFNVSAYAADSMLFVSLVDGSVGIKISGQDIITRLNPTQTASYNVKNGKMEVYNRNANEVALWRMNELVLVNTVTNTLYKKMESWYGFRIKLTNQPTKKHLYNMTIRNENIEEMLKMVNKITPIKYSIHDKEVTIIYIN